MVGLLGDETGIIKFTAWKNAELPRLEQEKVTSSGVVVGEYTAGSGSAQQEQLMEKLEPIRLGRRFYTSCKESEFRSILTLWEASGLQSKESGSALGKLRSIGQAGLIGDHTGVVKSLLGKLRTS